MADAFPPKLKLHHHTPAWVSDDAVFHIRIRCAPPPLDSAPLTTPALAATLLDSARLYHARQRWWCRLFLLMPDHLHALLAFPQPASMSRVIGDWKHYHTARAKIVWQDGYFDHRIRNARELDLKANYIRQNPVVKHLCSDTGDWAWFCEPASDIE